MEVGKKIREYRKLNNLTLKELSNKTDISVSFISDVENLRRNPSIETLQTIAEALDVDVATFFTLNTTAKIEDYIQRAGRVGQRAEKEIYFLEHYKTETKEVVSVPVVGTIRAGEPILAEQNILDYVYLPADLANNGEYFGLKVTGDSMNLSRILEGDIVLVRQQDQVENGEIAIVLVDGENATMKRFYNTDTTVTLMPNSSNPTHQPRIIDLNKIPVKILGKVVRAIINF